MISTVQSATKLLHRGPAEHTERIPDMLMDVLPSKGKNTQHQA